MFSGLTVLTSGCVAFSLPVPRQSAASSPMTFCSSGVFPVPPKPAQRAADKEWRFQARAAKATGFHGRKIMTLGRLARSLTRDGATRITGSDEQGGDCAARLIRRADA